MKTIFTLSVSDLRSTFREPLFKILIFFPFLSFAIVRWGYPAVVSLYPPIEPYSQVILMWACLQSATMFGFIYGFIFLEEKEENIYQVVQILPVSGFNLVTSRLIIGIIISTLVNFSLIHWGGIVEFEIWKEIVVAIHFSLAAPLIALYIGAFAKNKIEGLAQVKIINILVIIPAVIYFLPNKLAYLTAIVPTFWSFRLLEFAGDISNFSVYFVVGVLWYFACFFFLFRKLKSNSP